MGEKEFFHIAKQWPINGFGDWPGDFAVKATCKVHRKMPHFHRGFSNGTSTFCTTKRLLPPKRNDFWYSLCTLPLACRCFKVGPGKASSRECEKGAKRNGSSSESLFCRLFSRFLRWMDFENCQLLTGIPPLQTDKINLDLRNLYFTQKLFVPISCSQIKHKNWFVFKGRHFIIQIAFTPPHLWTTDYTMVTSGNNNPCVLDLDGKMFLCMRIFWPGCKIPGKIDTFSWRDVSTCSHIAQHLVFCFKLLF